MHLPIWYLTNQTSCYTLVQACQSKGIGQAHLHSSLDGIHRIHGKDGNRSSNCCSCQVASSFLNSRHKELQWPMWREVCLGAHSGDWSSAFANAEHQGDDQEKQAKDLHGAKARGKQHGYVGRLARRYDSTFPIQLCEE